VIGYFLRGVKEDHILVFRSDDPEELLQVIQRLGASRDKQMRALAQQLEINWFDSQYKEKKKS
jgi:HEPN domain-containing protein